jgi:anti-sigma factor RsiW
MNHHEKYREQLTLAAAGALEEHEERDVLNHAATCAECAATLQELQAVTGALRHLPVAQPPLEIVQRSIARAALEMAETADRHQRRNALGLALAAAWLMTLVSAGALKAVLALTGATIGLWFSLVVMTALTGSATVAVLCASPVGTRVLRRQG